jgi:TPR repeat protein
MFRRFTQIITSIAKAASPATPLGGVARDQKISSAGYEAYRKAVEDLSEGTEGLPGDIIDVPTISDLKGEPTAALTRQELEILGNAYVDGVPQAGVESDIAKSFEYWTAAGELGSLSAKFSMASCYFQGVGVPQDCAKAIGMLEELAEKHNFGEALVSPCLDIMAFSR